MMGFGGFGMFGMMFFWLVVVIVAVWLLSRLFPGVANSATGQNIQGQATSTAALDILKQRYARGEIGKAEYEEMSAVLNS